MNTMLIALFGFNQAMNNRLWEIIMAHLTDEQFVQTDAYSRGSTRNQLVHMADAQHYWLRGLLNVPNLPELNAEDYPTRATARAVCQRADQECLDQVRRLTDADLQRMPDIWSQPIWVGLMQLAHHSTDHRAQILRMLHDFGAPTMEQNFAIYMENATPMTLRMMLDQISSKRAEWDSLVRQVSSDHMTQPLLNAWTVRDVVAILTWKEQRLSEIIRNRAITPFSFSELPETEQSHILEASRALPLETLLDQHQAAHHEVMDALRTLTDADLNASEGIDGLPADERFWKAIAAGTWWSYPSFSAPLRELLNQRG